MKNKFAALVIAVVAVIAAASLLPAMAQDENSSRNPADIGAPVQSMVELGSVYTNLYDITITVVEAVRGNEALERLKTVSPNVKAPAQGSDYVLARIKFEMKGRAISDKLPFDLGDDPLQWIALSGSDLTEYDRVSVTVPKPALRGKVNPGQSVEGWVALAVASKDPKPLMVFDPDTGGATGRGRTLFFKLY